MYVTGKLEITSEKFEGNDASSSVKFQGDIKVPKDNIHNFISSELCITGILGR